MNNVNSLFLKIYLTTIFVIGLVFTGCNNDSNGNKETGTSGSQNGYKVTIHWQIPGETETIEETWADNTNSYNFSDHTKTRTGYYITGI